MSLEQARQAIDNVDTNVISLVAEFQRADQIAFSNDFQAFVESKPALKDLVNQRFDAVTQVVLSKLSTLSEEEAQVASSYRKDRHDAVLADRTARTVQAGGYQDIAAAFFNALLNNSVAEQNKYLQRGEGVISDRLEFKYS